MLESNSSIVGMGALQRRHPGVAAIRRMRVHPDHQRRGLGRQLLLALEARAVHLGYHTLVLDTTAQQHSAIALYTARGYTQTSQGRVGRFTMLYFEKVVLSRQSTSEDVQLANSVGVP